jgi:hypothetical protein
MRESAVRDGENTMHKFVWTCLAIIIGMGNMRANADVVKFNSPVKTVLDEGESTDVGFGMYTTYGDEFYSGYYRLNSSGGVYTGPPAGYVGGASTTNYSSVSGSLKYYQDGGYQTSLYGNTTVYNSNGSPDYGNSGYFSYQSPRTITVRNVAPTITNFTVNGATVGSVPYLNIYEGQSVSANMTATDPGLYDDLRFVVDVDNASQVTLGTDYDADLQRQMGGLVGDFTQSGPGYDIFELRGGRL